MKDKKEKINVYNCEKINSHFTYLLDFLFLMFYVNDVLSNEAFEILLVIV